MANHVLKNNHAVLQGLFKKLAELRQLNEFFAAYVDPSLGKHCQVIKYEKNCLFVLTENGSWTTQLRFQIPYLLNQLRKHSSLESLTGIICKTRPSGIYPAKQLPRRKVAALSQHTARKILDAAKTTTDLRIRAILEKIATRVKTV